MISWKQPGPGSYTLWRGGTCVGDAFLTESKHYPRLGRHLVLGHKGYTLGRFKDPHQLEQALERWLNA